MRGPALILAALLAGGLLAAGCQSTQATSAEREAEGEVLLRSEKPVKVTKQNPEMKILETKVLADKNGAAVVVVVRNIGDQSWVNVPISIKVEDGDGETVFKNNTGGLAASLTSIPVMRAGETFTWVNDQILAAGGTPKKVDVKVGFSKAELPEDAPRIEVTHPTLSSSDISGLEAKGKAEIVAGPDQDDITLFTVARRDGEIVAAGRSGIKHLLADRKKPTDFTTFFIGTPKEGDDLVTEAPPVDFTAAAK